jgi:hypothetical protein
MSKNQESSNFCLRKRMQSAFKTSENKMYLKPEDLSNFNVADVCCGHTLPLRFLLNHVVGHLRADGQTAQAATKVLKSR